MFSSGHLATDIMMMMICVNVSDGAPHVLRVRRADRRPLPAGGGRRRVAHRLPALLRLRRAARPPPLLLPARPTGLLQAGLCQVSPTY